MSALADIYWTQFKIRLAVQFQYRVSMVIWLIGMILEPVMYLVVWQTVAREQGGSVGGYSAGDFAAYYITLMIVQHLTFTWIMWEYEYYVKNGMLSGLLMRPIHPIHKDIAENIAYKVLTSFVIVPVAIMLAYAFGASFGWQPWSILVFMPALLLAGVIRFATGWTLAMAAFWTTRVSAFNSLYFVAVFFFAGQLAPLELFPSWLQTLSYLLPFRWMLSFPVELFLGRLDMQQTLIGFATQIGWVALCLGLLRFVWNAGVKQFSAVGS